MDPGALFNVRDVARIFGLHESRIRYWAQTGFINPSASHGGRRLYTFGDLVGIKAAKELLDRGIPLQRVRKNLQALRDALPQLAQPLGQLRVCSDGERLVVARKEGSFEPVSGQLVLDFEVDVLRTEIADLLELKRDAQQQQSPPRQIEIAADGADAAPAETEAELQPSTAYGWFARGCALDGDGDREEEALAAFERALALDPSLAAAHTNLGNLCYRRGDRAAAREHYQAACAIDPDQPEARYNMANLHEEQGELEMAIAEHRRALAANPDFADAHFNLALCLEQVGSRVLARSHWQRFVDLVDADDADDEEWLAIARAHLAELASDS
jgi:tetratricopeptide (TPR) repeat protein